MELEEESDDFTFRPTSPIPNRSARPTPSRATRPPGSLTQQSIPNRSFQPLGSLTQQNRFPTGNLLMSQFPGRYSRTPLPSTHYVSTETFGVGSSSEEDYFNPEESDEFPSPAPDEFPSPTLSRSPSPVRRYPALSRSPSPVRRSPVRTSTVSRVKQPTVIPSPNVSPSQVWSLEELRDIFTQLIVAQDLGQVIDLRTAQYYPGRGIVGAAVILTPAYDPPYSIIPVISYNGQVTQVPVVVDVNTDFEQLLTVIINGTDYRTELGNIIKTVEDGKGTRKHVKFTQSIIDFETASLFQQLRAKNQLIDIILVASDGTEYSAHKVVLGAVSPYFLALFTSQFKEANQNRIQLQVDSRYFGLLLDWIYGVINITDYYWYINIMVMQLAHEYQIDLDYNQWLVVLSIPYPILSLYFVLIEYALGPYSPGSYLSIDLGIILEQEGSLRSLASLSLTSLQELRARVVRSPKIALELDKLIAEKQG